MQSYNFGEAGRQIYDFLWSEFADWYVELAKVQLDGDAAQQQATRAVLYSCTRRRAAAAAPVHAIRDRGGMAVSDRC